jgi:hypothetical protein
MLYALRFKDTKKLVRLEVSSNGDEKFCGSLTYTLIEPISVYDEQKNSIWTTSDYKKACLVAKTNVPWYNADAVDYPENGFVGRLEVVRLEVVPI